MQSKETDVKRVLSLVMALGVAALFSSVTLAGAECSYHKTQAAAPSDASKDVAAVQTPDKVATDQVKTAEATPATPPAAQPAPVKTK